MKSQTLPKDVSADCRLKLWSPQLPPVVLSTADKTIFDAAPLGFAVTRTDGSFIRVNRRLCEMLGLSREELEAALLHEVLFKHTGDEKQLPLETICDGHLTEYSTQIVYETAEKSIRRWMRLTITAADTADKSRPYLLCAFEDVTARTAEKHAYEYQRGRYEQLLALSASLPGALSIYRLLPDGTSHIEFVTPSFSHLLGYLPGELAPDGKTKGFKNVHPEDVADLVTSIITATKNQEPWRAEYRVIHPERGLVNILETAAPETEVDGSIVWYCFLQDVTERNRDQSKLRQAAAVFENSQEAIAIVDARGMIISVNPSFRRVSGIKDSDFQSRAALQRLFHGNLQTYRHALMSVRQSEVWQGEVLFKTTNGIRVPQWVVVSPVKNEMEHAINYVVSMLDISRIKQTEKQLNHLALHDTLTGLPNRLLLDQCLNIAIGSTKARGQKGAVLFIDLDRFKTVNDSLGHKAGDELLCTVAERLQLRVRGSDTVARLGGDEFVIILNDIDADENACKIARDIIDLIEAPVTVLTGHDVYVSASIGISYFPKDSMSADQLIQCADAALYLAKDSGRGTYQLYDLCLTEIANKKLETETRMRQALAKGEFELYYQPIMDLQRNIAVGAEALIRWNDPKNGFIQPMSFIPLAEETGFIVPLGDWIIRTACLQLRQWEKSGHSIDALSINLSARQFKLTDLPLRIETIFKSTGVSPEKIHFEITESALMEEGEVALEKLLALKALGVRLSIDDFGTGYSSLSMLKKFPIDTLKIDRSFIRDVTTNTTSRNIALAIISLAKTLNLKMVAEGVEEEDQKMFLYGEGCHFAQGYLFKKPMTSKNFELWFSDQLPVRSIALQVTAVAA